MEKGNYGKKKKIAPSRYAFVGGRADPFAASSGVAFV
jgi:hypothetical protein